MLDTIGVLVRSQSLFVLFSFFPSGGIGVNTTTGASAAPLTDNSKHAGGLGGLGVALILGFIIHHRLVHNKDVLASQSRNFILLPFSDFTPVLEPADLRGSSRYENGPT